MAKKKMHTQTEADMPDEKDGFMLEAYFYLDEEQIREAVAAWIFKTHGIVVDAGQVSLDAMGEDYTADVRLDRSDVLAYLNKKPTGDNDFDI